MEDSENRRERLKAMRTEAAQAEASSNVEASAVPGFLPNPLFEIPAQEASFATQRFDFYTDPMAAFSSNKKRSVVGDQAAYFTSPSNMVPPMGQFLSSNPGSRNPNMTPHLMQSHYSPNQGTYQAQGPYNSPVSHWSPRSSPLPIHHGTPGAWGGSGPLANNSATHRVPYPAYEGNPGFQPRRRPTFNHGQGRGSWLGNSPRIGSGYGGNATHSGRGHTQWHGGSRSPFPRQSSGRGRGFQSRGTRPDGPLRPESFYDKSMFEDPWQHLEPVLWRGQEPDSSNSWLPKSIGVKKARVSEPSNKFTSQQSLAEYLAASFNEATGYTPSV